MFVKKRNGVAEPVQFDKILFRVRAISESLKVDATLVAQKVVAGLYDGILTADIDTLLAETAAVMATEHPDYSKLASRIAVSNLHKQTKNFYQAEKDLYKAGILSSEFTKLIKLHGKKLEKVIDYNRDFDLNYHGFKALEKSYLLKIDGKVVERPQHLFMRVALQVSGESFEEVVQTYDLISKGYYTHATPTLFNSGALKPQLASCFAEGTPVFTANRGVVPIESVQVGDEVVTHKNRFKKVQQVHENDLGDRQLYSIKCYRTPRMSVTGNHRFWSLTKEQEAWGEKPGWNALENLRVGDLIALPSCDLPDLNLTLDLKEILGAATDTRDSDGQIVRSVKYDYDEKRVHASTSWSHRNLNHDQEIVCNRDHKPVKRFWKLDKEFLWFIGVWLGDGSIYSRTKAKKEDLRGISITASREAVDLFERCKKIGDEVFGVKCSEICESSHDNSAYIKWESFVIPTVFEALLGRGYAGKNLPPSFMKLSRSEFLILLQGLISADGCVTKTGAVTVQLTNTKLCTQLFHMGRSLGIPLSLTVQEKVARLIMPSFMRQVILSENIYKLYSEDRLSVKDSKEKRSNCIDGQFFLRLDAKEKSTEKPAKVYTLGVEEDHSYMVNGLLAENCFLMEVPDSIEGIFGALGEAALISKSAGGIGVHIHKVRAAGSYIKGTNGRSTGILPMLKVWNDTARYVNQGGKRPGAFAIFLEPWHADVETFLDLRKNTGKDEIRCRDLFLALWVPDLFMARVEADGVWSLMCPNECQGLSEVYGEEFEKLYTDYEAQGKYRKQIRARDLMTKIVETQIECGVPYFLFKDHINKKSNQKNIGVIQSSNLCCEITEVSNQNETAVCNLASLCLPKYVVDGVFDFAMLHQVTKAATVNLNNVIDRTFYPLKKTTKSNLAHRPIGLGVQGLADVFFLLDLPFDSPEARALNAQIFETIYHAALEASCELAEKFGHYATFHGSPASQGTLQFDFCGLTPSMYEWDLLKEKIKDKGLRNSLLIAPMPTASTASIFDNNECFEAQTSNIYKREVLSGEFVVINKHLIKKLEELDLWNKEIRDEIISSGGSIQTVDSIPDEVKAIYKTVWEISQKVVIDLAADRQAFVDQSQSMNIFIADPTVAQVNSALFYGWKRGLKTGLYYLRSKPAMKASKVTTRIADSMSSDEQLACSLENPDACVACSA